MKESLMSIAAVFLFGCAVMGCANERTDFRFKVIDSATGQSLPGAQLTVESHGHHFDNRLFPDREVKPGFVSDGDGYIFAHGVLAGVGWECHLTFTCPRYQTLEVTNSVASSSDRWVFYYKEPDFPGATLDNAEQGHSRAKTNTIRMRRFRTG